MSPSEQPQTGLYIHIPFCLRRCVYCDFYVEPLGTGPLPQRFAQLEHLDQTPFIQALHREWDHAPSTFHPHTIYIGGGTPTELPLADFRRLMEMVKARVSNPQEWTVECNPGTLSDSHIEVMLECGVTRVSLGVQSFQNDTLNFLTRIHSAEEARTTYHRLRKAGFNNINLDLMFAIPGTGLEHVERDLSSLLELDPEHVSCYSLDYEPNTQLTPLAKKGFVQPVDDELAVAQFELIRNTLATAGYHHYEISNYAKPGSECRNNQQTWQGGEYLGFGPAAASHWQGQRWRNAPDLHSYLSQGPQHIEYEQLDPETKARELLMTSLRQVAGIDRSWFHARTGYDYEDLRGQEIAQCIEAGWLERTPEGIRLTPSGMPMSNQVFEQLV